MSGCDPTRGYVAEECISCGEGTPRGECPDSQRDCGHHCDHSWTHDACCWCLTEFGEAGAETRPPIRAMLADFLSRYRHPAGRPWTRQDVDRLARQFEQRTASVSRS